MEAGHSGYQRVHGEASKMRSAPELCSPLGVSSDCAKALPLPDLAIWSTISPERLDRVRGAMAYESVRICSETVALVPSTGVCFKLAVD